MALCVPVTSPERLPENPVLVDALPLSVAVITPAEKLPLESLSTIVLGVLVDVAALAMFLWNHNEQS